tara:strand:- start:469 stop:714 length:246 start_codon:yes stop_codon:yes gene_type:complete
LDFRQQTVNDFAIVFNGTNEESDRISTDEQFAKKWSWFGIMYRLTNGEIVNLERITKLSLYECLTWLSYEVDLNEIKTVQR